MDSSPALVAEVTRSLCHRSRECLCSQSADGSAAQRGAGGAASSLSDCSFRDLGSGFPFSDIRSKITSTEGAQVPLRKRHVWRGGKSVGQWSGLGNMAVLIEDVRQGLCDVCGQSAVSTNTRLEWAFHVAPPWSGGPSV